MNRTFISLTALLALGTTAVLPVIAQTAPPNALNFQGRLAQPNGSPVPDGTYNLRLRLYDAATAGNTLVDQSLTNTPVKNGVFAVQLSGFTADKFNGNTWLGISINGGADLTPRTQIVSVPYAIKSNLALSVPDGSITNAKIAAGTLTADRFVSGTLNGTAWLLNGNSGVTSGFLGTTDNNPLEFRVNSHRAIRYQYADYTASPGYEYRSINVLGGSEINTISAGVVGATIAGGGIDYFTGTDYPNAVTANFGTIGGGTANQVNGSFSTIGGGGSNTASGPTSTIAGGTMNTASGNYSTLGGGDHNMVSGNYSIVGGGESNTASVAYSTIVGGYNNTANASFASLGGGSNNTSGGYGSTVGGGLSNVAYGNYSTVAGGSNNTASGDYSAAMGSSAFAYHTGAFVWADSQNATFMSSAPNQFCIRANGGIVVEENGDAALYTSSTSGEQNRYLSLFNSPQSPSASGLRAGGILCSDSYAYANPGKNNLIVKGTASIGYAGGIAYNLFVNGTTYTTTLYTSSDARYKKNIALLDTALDTLLKLRGVSYDWDKAKFPELNFGDGKQFGFIAQELEQVLPELVKTDAKGYKAVNYVGVVPVLVEAVKTLNARTVIQQKQNDAKDAQIAELKTTLAEVMKRLEALEKNNK